MIRSQTEQNVTALAELHLYLKEKFPWVFKESQVASLGSSCCPLLPSVCDAELPEHSQHPAAGAGSPREQQSLHAVCPS